MDTTDLKNLCILLVEDHPGSRRLTRSMLNHIGIRNVEEAIDGKDALASLAASRPDLIICDWNMKPMDGLDFVKQVRVGENPDEKTIPIIMLSAHAERQRVEIARDAGVNEFLVKPVSIGTLHDRIRAVAGNHREFIVSNDYVGPDRRRRSDEAYRGPDRRNGREATEIDYVEPKEEDYQEAIMNLRHRVTGGGS